MNFDTRESYLEIDIGLRAKLTGVKNGDVRIRDHFQIFYGLKLWAWFLWGAQVFVFEFKVNVDSMISAVCAGRSQGNGQVDCLLRSTQRCIYAD